MLYIRERGARYNSRHSQPAAQADGCQQTITAALLAPAGYSSILYQRTLVHQLHSSPGSAPVVRRCGAAAMSRSPAGVGVAAIHCRVKLKTGGAIGHAG